MRPLPDGGVSVEALSGSPLHEAEPFVSSLRRGKGTLERANDLLGRDA